MIKFIEAIENGIDYSGSSCVSTYCCGDFFIKKFYDIDLYLMYVKTHNDLDDSCIIPKMLDNFVHDDCGYIVVEAVEQLDKDLIDKLGVNSDEALHDNIEDYETELSMLIDEADRKGYDVDDIHRGNFGFNSQGDFVCLDEGCFCLYSEDSLTKQMMEEMC